MIGGGQEPPWLFEGPHLRLCWPLARYPCFNYLTIFLNAWAPQPKETVALIQGSLCSYHIGVLQNEITLMENWPAVSPGEGGRERTEGAAADWIVRPCHSHVNCRTCALGLLPSPARHLCTYLLTTFNTSIKLHCVKRPPPREGFNYYIIIIIIEYTPARDAQHTKHKVETCKTSNNIKNIKH